MSGFLQMKAALQQVLAWESTALKLWGGGARVPCKFAGALTCESPRLRFAVGRFTGVRGVRGQGEGGNVRPNMLRAQQKTKYLPWHVNI